MNLIISAAIFTYAVGFLLSWRPLARIVLNKREVDYLKQAEIDNRHAAWVLMRNKQEYPDLYRRAKPTVIEPKPIDSSDRVWAMYSGALLALVWPLVVPCTVFYRYLFANLKTEGEKNRELTAQAEQDRKKLAEAERVLAEYQRTHTLPTPATELRLVDRSGCANGIHPDGLHYCPVAVE